MDNDKIDQLLELTKENNKILKELLFLIKQDTPGREFLLNLGADLLGDILMNGKNRK